MEAIRWSISVMTLRMFSLSIVIRYTTLLRMQRTDLWLQPLVADWTLPNSCQTDKRVLCIVEMYWNSILTRGLRADVWVWCLMVRCCLVLTTDYTQHPWTIPTKRWCSISTTVDLTMFIVSVIILLPKYCKQSLVGSILLLLVVVPMSLFLINFSVIRYNSNTFL